MPDGRGPGARNRDGKTKDDLEGSTRNSAGKGDLPTIEALIARHMEWAGLETTRALARRGPVHHTTWEKLATGNFRGFNDPETISGIAATLGESEAVVLLAIARSLGMNVSARVPAIPLPAGVETLGSRQRRAIWDVAVAMIDAARGDSK